MAGADAEDDPAPAGEVIEARHLFGDHHGVPEGGDEDRGAQPDLFRHPSGDRERDQGVLPRDRIDVGCDQEVIDHPDCAEAALLDLGEVGHERPVRDWAAAL